MKSTTGKLSDWVVKIACGRDLETQLQEVAATGQHGAPQVLRTMALAANGFAGAPQQADLALVFGCYIQPEASRWARQTRKSQVLLSKP